MWNLLNRYPFSKHFPHDIAKGLKTLAIVLHNENITHKSI